MPLRDTCAVDSSGMSTILLASLKRRLLAGHESVGVKGRKHRLSDGWGEGGLSKSLNCRDGGALSKSNPDIEAKLQLCSVSSPGLGLAPQCSEVEYWRQAEMV